MPTVLKVNPFKDGDEPQHIHVERDDCTAKLWLDPVRVERSIGFRAVELRTIERMVAEHRDALTEAWTEFDHQFPAVMGVSLTDDVLTVELSDGRTISVPLAWYPRLLHARPDERRDWRLIAHGEGIQWLALDEDISVESLIRGKAPARARLR